MIDLKSTMNQNSGEEFERFRVGKELPYRIPDGFFDAMPERTLQKAKGRFKKHQRQVLFTSGFTVFAVAAAILAFVFLLPNGAPKQEHRLVAVVKQFETVPPKTAPAVKLNSGNNHVKTVATKVPSTDESLEEILKNLSDQDLTELLAEYKAEDIEEALSSETTNIN